MSSPTPVPGTHSLYLVGSMPQPEGTTEALAALNYIIVKRRGAAEDVVNTNNLSQDPYMRAVAIDTVVRQAQYFGY